MDSQLQRQTSGPAESEVRSAAQMCDVVASIEGRVGTPAASPSSAILYRKKERTARAATPKSLYLAFLNAIDHGDIRVGLPLTALATVGSVCANQRCDVVSCEAISYWRKPRWSGCSRHWG